MREGGGKVIPMNVWKERGGEVIPIYLLGVNMQIRGESHSNSRLLLSELAHIF